MWSCADRPHCVPPTRAMLCAANGSQMGLVARILHVARILQKGRGPVLVIATALASQVLPGCALGPEYRRPPVVTPEVTRGQTGSAEPASLADLPCGEAFRNPS